MPIVWGTPEASELIARKARALIRGRLGPLLREAVSGRTMPDEESTRRIGVDVYDALMADAEIGALRIEREDVLAYFDAVKAECLSAIRLELVRLSGG